MSMQYIEFSINLPHLTKCIQQLTVNNTSTRKNLLKSDIDIDNLFAITYKKSDKNNKNKAISSLTSDIISELCINDLTNTERQIIKKAVTLTIRPNIDNSYNTITLNDDYWD